MRTAFVLLTSPFLGPSVWEPLASVLVARGHDVVVPSLPPVPLHSPEEVLRALRDSIPAHADPVLVPHSNAGLYVPALVAARPVRAAVFLDAVLPPAEGRIPVAPERLRGTLRSRVGVDGLLPYWSEWWPEADVAALFPDPRTRRRVEADQRRVPWDYLLADVVVPRGWDAIPAGYVAFGTTYADELQRAADRGWPVRSLDGRHLHMTCDPEAVASALVEVTAELEKGGGQGHR